MPASMFFRFPMLVRFCFLFLRYVLFVTYVVLFQLYASYSALNKIKRFVYIEIEAYFCSWFNNEDIPINNIKQRKYVLFGILPLKSKSI